MIEAALVIAAICLIVCASGVALVFRQLDRIEAQQIGIARAVAELKTTDTPSAASAFELTQKQYEEALNNILSYSLQDAYKRGSGVSD